MQLERKQGFYEKYVKRILDIVCSFTAILLLSWLFLIIAAAVKIKMGSPVLFRQPRPGIIRNGKETIFEIYKFRTMKDMRDEEGVLFPDEQRLSRFGKMLRALSLDELPEMFNILKGEMSFIGPRPQLVKDMVFMDDRTRMRHTARPGLSGLAQVNGRNAVPWEEKFDFDLKYIEKISFLEDMKIVWLTIKMEVKRLCRNGKTDEINVTDDYGDALLKAGKISREEYALKQKEALKILEERT